MLLPFCLYPSILYTSFLYFPLKHTQSFFTFLHNSIIHQSLFASLHPYLSLFTLSFFNLPHYILITNPYPHSSLTFTILLFVFVFILHPSFFTFASYSSFSSQTNSFTLPLLFFHSYLFLIHSSFFGFSFSIFNLNPFTLPFWFWLILIRPSVFFHYLFLPHSSFTTYSFSFFHL